MIKKLKLAIDNAEKIVFFGGAGVSTESGLKDFRGKDGLNKETFNDLNPETILSIDFFMNHTEEFYKHYRTMFLEKQVKPNDAHKYLAYLEKKGHNITIITQNIDNLHQEAGSRNVIELHGSIFRNFGIKTKERLDGISHLINSKGVPMTKSGDILKPDVILYGEPLNNEVINQAIRALNEADLLIVAGTSLTVYPAANLIHYFKGNNVFAINRDYIPINNFIQGDIGKIFNKLRREEQ